MCCGSVPIRSAFATASFELIDKATMDRGGIGGIISSLGVAANYHNKLGHNTATVACTLPYHGDGAPGEGGETHRGER